MSKSAQFSAIGRIKTPQEIIISRESNAATLRSFRTWSPRSKVQSKKIPRVKRRQEFHARSSGFIIHSALDGLCDPQLLQCFST
jgi:hypothetical protein